MRGLILILTFLTLVSCNDQSDAKVNTSRKPRKSINTFATCFVNHDTSNIGQTIACTGGTYKRINEKYVISISPELPIQFDSCYIVTIDGSNADRLAELLIFDKKDAHLSNSCTDLVPINAPKPTRQLQAQSGELIIGFSDTTEYYGHKTYHTTVLIKRLIFVDHKTNEKIELKNELLWKVLHTGTPG